MAKKRVSIRDIYATLYHDFPFGLNDELVIDADGNTGIVQDAVWEGEDTPATFYTVTYSLRTESGEQRQMELNELLAFNKLP
jgi:hypothetical protein